MLRPTSSPCVKGEQEEDADLPGEFEDGDWPVQTCIKYC